MLLIFYALTVLFRGLIEVIRGAPADLRSLSVELTLLQHLDVTCAACHIGPVQQKQ
jgi:hypothetical protein